MADQTDNRSHRLIFTVWIEPESESGEKTASRTKTLGDRVIQCTHKAMQDYADKVGADFRIVSDRKYAAQISELTSTDAPAQEKLRLIDFLHDYDRVLYLDSDILICSSAGDIFAEHPDEQRFYAVDESGPDREKTVARLCADFGVTDWPVNDSGYHAYFNSGMLLASKAQHTALREFDAKTFAEIYRIDKFVDQTYLNYLIRKHQVPFQAAGRRFNFTNRYISRRSDRFSADFIHYAGAGFILFAAPSPYRKVRQLRDLQTLRDYQRLYGRRFSFSYLSLSTQMLTQYAILSMLTFIEIVRRVRKK